MKPAHLMPITDEVMERWQEWLAARDKCEREPIIKNGIAAGQAWARWLDLFEGGSHG